MEISGTENGVGARIGTNDGPGAGAGTRAALDAMREIWAGARVGPLTGACTGAGTPACAAGVGVGGVGGFRTSTLVGFSPPVDARIGTGAGGSTKIGWAIAGTRMVTGVRRRTIGARGGGLGSRTNQTTPAPTVVAISTTASTTSRIFILLVYAPKIIGNCS